MSYFLDRLTFFKQVFEDFFDGCGAVTNEALTWQEGYRKRCQYDKIVRHLETQQTDYPALPEGDISTAKTPYGRLVSGAEIEGVALSRAPEHHLS